MIQNKTLYLPASGGSIQSTYANNVSHAKNGKSLRIYNEDGIYHYPYFLISAGHNYKKDIIEKWGYDLNKTIVMGDSGGYQLATGAIDYTEEIVDKILNWLEHNTNYALNIDFPPYRNFVYKDIDGSVDDFFREKLEISVNNFKYFAEHKKNQTKLMNVLHGRDLPSLNTWYDRVKDFQFEGGWAIGSVKDQPLSYMLMDFFYLLEKGEIERLSKLGNCFVHFLGFSKLKDIPYLIFIQNKLNEMNLDIRISFDSSTAFINASYALYYVFFKRAGMTPINISSNLEGYNSKINYEMGLPCTCPVCKDLNYGFLYKDGLNGKGGFKSDVYTHMMIHNLYKFIEYKEIIENIILGNNYKIIENFFKESEMKIFKLIDQTMQEEYPTKYMLKHMKLYMGNYDNEKINETFKIRGDLF